MCIQDGLREREDGQEQNFNNNWVKKSVEDLRNNDQKERFVTGKDMYHEKRKGKILCILVCLNLTFR